VFVLLLVISKQPADKERGQKRDRTECSSMGLWYYTHIKTPEG
jgi:hypothetical protein